MAWLKSRPTSAGCFFFCFWTGRVWAGILYSLPLASAKVGGFYSRSSLRAIFGGFMNSFERAWQLVGQSFSVLRQDKKLVVFPALSALSTLAIAAAYILPLFRLH